MTPKLSERVVIVNLRGGIDTMTSYVYHGLNAYYSRRPNIAVPAPNPGNVLAALPAETGFGFHPLLSELHTAYTNGEMAIVQKTGYPSPNLSHFSSQDIMSKGVRDLAHPDTRGWLGRLGDLYFTETIKIVGVGTGNKLDYVSNGFKPVVVDDLASLTIPTDAGQPTDSTYRNDKAEEILSGSGPLTGLRAQIASSTESAFELAESIQNAIANYPGNVTYPNTTFANNLRDISQLIFANLGTQVFYVETGGFDTHANQINSVGNLYPNLSQGLGAFITDLKGMGAYSNTTLILLSEFGRRNFENGGGGTDHGHGVHFAVIGGSVNGGRKGQAVTNADLLLDYLPGEVDFRQVYSEVIQDRLCVDPTPVFPDWTHPGGSLNLF